MCLAGSGEKPALYFFTGTRQSMYLYRAKLLTNEYILIPLTGGAQAEVTARDYGYYRQGSGPGEVDIIREQVQSGQSIKSFCTAHGLSEGTFHNWKTKYKVGDEPKF